MHQTFASHDGPTVQLPLMVVAEVQDSLLVVMHDLQRLEGLLGHAANNLMERFGAALQVLNGAEGAAHGGAAIEGARSALRDAVTELQFQDMASQLIVHTTQVLQGCAFRIASEAMGQEEGEEAMPDTLPQRPNPVTQSEMDAGSIELF